MNRAKIRSLLLSLALVSLNYSCFKSEERNIKQTNFSAKETAELDSFIVGLHKALPIPGLAVCIIKDDKVYYKTIGYREIETKEPLTDTTSIFMGSISEAALATALIRHSDTGKIKLEDPVVKHLPYFKLAGDSYRNITVRHLLTHTSGVPKHQALFDLPDFSANALENTTRSISLQQPEFSPGTAIKRTPYNFDILADLISKSTKTSCQEFVRQNLFLALGMRNATFWKQEIVPNSLARPHSIKDPLTYSLKKNSVYPFNPEHAGSTGFHASVKDVSKWMWMLLHNRAGENEFLSKEAYEQLMSPHFQSSENTFAGLGWEIIRDHKKINLVKTSEIGGFTGHINLIPEDKIGVFVMSNIGEEFNAVPISKEIIAWLKGRELPQRKTPIHILMGRKYAETNSVDSALAVYRRLKNTKLKEYDFSPSALNKFGVNLLYKLNKPKEALEVFRFCLKENPNSSSSYLNLAEAQLLLDDAGGAGKSLQKAKTLPKDEFDIEARIAFLQESLQVKKENSKLAFP